MAAESGWRLQSMQWLAISNLGVAKVRRNVAKKWQWQRKRSCENDNGESWRNRGGENIESMAAAISAKCRG